MKHNITEEVQWEIVHMVDIQFLLVDEHIVVRFRRQFQSSLLNTAYMATELILIAPHCCLQEIKADCAVYVQLPRPLQCQILAQLRTTRHYRGRLIPDYLLPEAFPAFDQAIKNKGYCHEDRMDTLTRTYEPDVCDAVSVPV